MVPTDYLEDTVAPLVAQDATKMANPLDAPLVTLVAAAFVPGRATRYAGLVPATYTGSAPKSVTAGNQTSFRDTVSGEQVVQLIAPAGGWNWVCSATPGATETIYGYVITNQAADRTYASGLLQTPVPISNIGDAVTIGDLRMGLPLGTSWQEDAVGI